MACLLNRHIVVAPQVRMLEKTLHHKCGSRNKYVSYGNRYIIISSRCADIVICNYDRREQCRTDHEANLQYSNIDNHKLTMLI